MQGARGRILPRNARPNEDTHFTYTLLPQSSERDEGFDRLRFALPAASRDVEVRVGGQAVEARRLDERGDSLLIELPAMVLGDSVEVAFTTRVVQNATVFGLDLGSSAHPDLWQSVEPAERRANIVMLPELVDSGDLIGDLTLSSPVLTPNGDGINDALSIRFVPFKWDAGERPARAGIFDLAGRLIAELAPPQIDRGAHVFTWSGRGAKGVPVAPGSYVLRIDLDADSGRDTALRSVAVAY